MSNYEKARKMREEFDNPDVFGGKINFRQLWWIIKLVKTVRKFARSNAALYNLLNELFRGIATFREVQKIRKYCRAGESPTYPGLEITMKVDGVEITQREECHGYEWALWKLGVPRE